MHVCLKLFFTILKVHGVPYKYCTNKYIYIYCSNILAKFNLKTCKWISISWCSQLSTCTVLLIIKDNSITNSFICMTAYPFKIIKIKQWISNNIVILYIIHVWLRSTLISCFYPIMLQLHMRAQTLYDLMMTHFEMLNKKLLNKSQLCSWSLLCLQTLQSFSLK